MGHGDLVLGAALQRTGLVCLAILVVALCRLLDLNVRLLLVQVLFNADKACLEILQYAFVTEHGDVQKV